VARRSLSLRSRAYLAVIAVVLGPILGVEIAGLFGDGERARMERRALAAAEDLRAHIEIDGARAEDAVAEIARREGVRLTLVDASGRVAATRDHDQETSLRDRVGDLFFGPGGAPTLRAYDATRPPLLDRAEIAAAKRGDSAAGCAVAMNGKLLVCHAVMPIDAPEGTLIALAEKSSPRAIRALFDVRGAVLKLTIYVLLGAILLAAWLARRIVRPIERLRREVLARTAAPLAGQPIPAPTSDELGDLAGAFNTLLAAIAEKSRQNHAFMADLVHELKSPVAAVRAAADALAEGPADEARAKRLGRVLGESSRRLDALVSEFLDLARAEAGLPNEERSAIDAAELCETIAAAMRDDERYAGVRFEVEAEHVTVEGVPARLERAIGNLMENAASFAGEGGAVRAFVRAEEGACTIEVRDTGPGIAKEDLGRIFERFFTKRPDGRGTGLGLALAKAIVEAHGGSIAASSPEGGGAILTVRLLRTRADGAAVRG
jgi:two-component system sensor histidine kinase ChvG